MEALTGKLLSERYRVEEFFGHGGMADVYKVWDQQRAAFLAMKVLHNDLAEDAVLLRRFKREAHVLERLQHPNIVRFYGLEEWGGLAYILMDFIDGLTLRKEVSLHKKGIRPARVLQLVQPVCAALHYAHQLGMVHCDIKPANIMIHRNGTVYLADFGIARAIEGRTQPLPTAGTPAYMAPELMAGEQPTPAADIYALGVVIYEMLTGGERPFSGLESQSPGSTTQRIVWEKHNLEAPPPSRFNPAISPELEAVTLHCLERDPEARFASVMDLSDMLYQAVHGNGENLEIQTLVDIHKTKSRDPALALHPEWLDSILSSAPEDSSLENILLENAVPAEQPLGTGRSSELPVQEIVSAGALAAQTAPADGEPAHSLDAGQAVRRKTFHRAWSFAALAGIIVLAVFIGLAVSQQRPGILSAAVQVSQAAPEPSPSSPTADGSPATAGTPVLSGDSTFTPPPAALSSSLAQPGAAPAAGATPAAAEAIAQLPPTPLGGGAGEIAFASDRGGSVQIWIMEVSTPTNRRQVTDLPGGACQPAWSPDGMQIAFTTPCNGPRLTYPGATIKIINLESGEIRDLRLQGSTFDPDWSPDGSNIAFTTFLGSKTEIHAVSLVNLKTRPLSQRGSKNSAPDWSPDGEHIAFSSDDQGVDEIWMMRSDGSSQEMLTQAGGLKYFTSPDWSPDGSQLLAGMKEINLPSPVDVLVQIELASPRQGGKPLLQETLRMEDGVFSPDGKVTAFWTVVEASNMEVFLASLDGKLTRLTDHKARDFHPAWRPTPFQGK